MLSIKTKLLQNLVSKLNKCSSSRLLEITRYWHIIADDQGIEIVAMDGNNYMTVLCDDVKGELDVIVRADQFGKLVEKTSSEKITIKQKENYLSVIGNGEYKVEIVVGEDYPEYDSLMDDESIEPVVVDTKYLKSIAAINKSTVSNTNTDGFLTGYLMTPKAAITSDAIKVCINPIEFIPDTVLLTPEIVKMVQSITDESCDVYYKDGMIEFVGSDTIIYGAEMDGKEEFPDLQEYAKAKLPSKGKVSKFGIQQIVDRLTLFLGEFDKGDILLTFKDKVLNVQTKSGSYERIELVPDEGNTDDFTCSINVTFLKDILSSISNETFFICYGEDGYVKIEDDGVIYVLATNEEE